MKNILLILLMSLSLVAKSQDDTIIAISYQSSAISQQLSAVSHQSSAISHSHSHGHSHSHSHGHSHGHSHSHSHGHSHSQSHLKSYWHSGLTVLGQPLHYDWKDWTVFGGIATATTFAFVYDDEIYDFVNNTFTNSQSNTISQYSDIYGEELFIVPSIALTYCFVGFLVVSVF